MNNKLISIPEPDRVQAQAAPGVEPPIVQENHRDNTESCSLLTTEERKASRTPGLRLFDVLLYPVFTNGFVFGISVAATYFTSKGNKTGGKVGRWFYSRGEKMTRRLEAMGMTHDQADMAKMVAWSFIDGSAAAPLVKVVEDQREQIAYSMDKAMHTVPADKSVYDAEPEQSWGSVLGGRLATFSVVFPTAVVLEKAGLNKVLFKDPGLKIGRWVQSRPNLAKKFGDLDIPELGKIGMFETFYTSLCTGGLYTLSRGLAALQGRKHFHAHELNGEGPHEPADAELQNAAPPALAQSQSSEGWRKELAAPSQQYAAAVTQQRELGAGMERA